VAGPASRPRRTLSESATQVDQRRTLGRDSPQHHAEVSTPTAARGRRGQRFCHRRVDAEVHPRRSCPDAGLR
jgi:hypothetical protein